MIISYISAFANFAFSNASIIGYINFLKTGSQIYSNFALVIEILKSCYERNKSNLVSVSNESISFALLHFSLIRLKATLSFFRSILFSSLNKLTQWSTNKLSKSCPPKWVSPLVALTSLIPLPIHSTETSKVPPPKSNTRMFLSSTVLFSKSNARLAAVGSLIILRTLRPAIFPAS